MSFIAVDGSLHTMYLQSLLFLFSLRQIVFPTRMTSASAFLFDPIMVLSGTEVLDFGVFDLDQ